MKPTIAVMSYRMLTSLINKTSFNFADPVRVLLIDAIFDDAIKKAQELEANEEVDVFVSAGGNAQLLSQHIQTPLVEIKITGFDILLALMKAKKYGGKVGIVSFQSKIPYLDQVAGLLTMSVKQVTYDQPEEIDFVLEGLRREGIDTVVGASLVFEKTKEKKMNRVFVYSTDGVVRAMEAAAKVAVSKKAESEKAEKFRIIMDFAYGGIIAVDKDGKVTVFNPSAEKIVGVPRQKVLGAKIETILPTTRLTEVIRSGQPELNQLQNVGDIKILTNRLPIIVNGEVVGAVATFQDIGAIQEAEEKIRQRLYQKGFLAKVKLEDIVGDSAAIRSVKSEAGLYAQSDSTVLIVGESGTGKELFAQGIHNAGARSKRPFIAVNCAALPETLLESELFGYEEGAFTGARKGGKPGFFELAHGGTIFLDEIGEISTAMQSRLLRVLEEHEVMRIGGSSIIPVNIRAIAATNKNLWAMVERGTFRHDLYYRLNVLELRLPPLRVHRNDIPALATRFLNELRPDLTFELVGQIAGHYLFRSYDWPGNVRELKNIVERFAVLYSGKGSPAQLLESLFRRHKTGRAACSEYEEIARVLREVNGSKSEAAKRLGISRTSLWRKLKEMPVEY